MPKEKLGYKQTRYQKDKYDFWHEVGSYEILHCKKPNESGVIVAIVRIELNESYSPANHEHSDAFMRMALRDSMEFDPDVNMEKVMSISAQETGVYCVMGMQRVESTVVA